MQFVQKKRRKTAYKKDNSYISQEHLYNRSLPTFPPFLGPVTCVTPAAWSRFSLLDSVDGRINTLTNIKLARKYL